MARLEQLKFEREVVKFKVVRIKTFVLNFDLDGHSINQIKTRLEILNDAPKKFDEIQNNIEKTYKTTSFETWMFGPNLKTSIAI